MVVDRVAAVLRDRRDKRRGCFGCLRRVVDEPLLSRDPLTAVAGVLFRAERANAEPCDPVLALRELGLRAPLADLANQALVLGPELVPQRKPAQHEAARYRGRGDDDDDG